MQMDQDTPQVELRQDIPSAARSVIDGRMKGLKLVAGFYPDPQTIILVSTDEEGKYHVTAFFQVGTEWATSLDAQGTCAEDAFQTLTRRLN